MSQKLISRFREKFVYSVIRRISCSYSELIAFPKEKRINRERFSSKQFMSYCRAGRQKSIDIIMIFNSLKWQNVIYVFELDISAV